jgi:hypothetical protein
MNSAARLALLYGLFAALATLANLGAQMLAVRLYGGAWAIELSMLAGTLVGLMVKYVLDKRHIFGFTSRSLAHDGRLFALYSLMGILTTLLFWGTEYAFHRLFATEALRYLGGALGLVLGYVIKYRLDKRFVFVGGASATAGAA